MNATAPDALQVGRRDPRADIRNIMRNQGIYVVLVAFVVVALLVVPEFATVKNATNILRSVSIVGIVAIGMTFIVISGSFVDLSVPAQVAASSIVVLVLAPDNLVLAIVAALGVTLVIGSFNGVLVAGGANPVLVTLAVQTIAAGAILELRGASNVYGEQGILESFGDSSIGPIPLLAVVFLLTAIAGHFLLRSTRFGFETYAVGANRAAARVSGVPVRRVVTGVFLISATLAGVAGIVLGAYANSANLNSGLGFEFDALTAVVVGGTSLFGGSGGVWRTVAGVLLIGVLNNVMILVGLPFEAQYLVKGTLIVFAVGLDAFLQRRGAAI